LKGGKEERGEGKEGEGKERGKETGRIDDFPQILS